MLRKMENVNVNNVTETIGLSKELCLVSLLEHQGGVLSKRHHSIYRISQSKSLEPKHMFLPRK